MKRVIRCCSFLLCFALLCTPVFAETTAAEVVSDSTAAVMALGEDVSLREPNVKYLNLSDGTAKAVVYADAVHYQKGDAWEEIDNSLTDAVLLGDGATGQVQRLDTLTATQRLTLSREARTEGQARYADYLENNANDFIVQLPRELAPEKPVMVRNKEHTLRFVPLNLTDSTAQVTQPTDQPVMTAALYDSAREEQQEQMTTVTGYKSKVEYSAISDQVDLRYFVVGQRLKEDLLLQELPQQTEFSFDFTTDLRPVLNEDNTVSFLDAQDDLVFMVEAPRMYDMGDGYSRDITVTVEPTAQGCRYTLTPDREWLEAEERVYPVTLDPSVVTTPDPHFIQDTGVQESNPDTNYYMMDRIYVGSGPNSTQGRLFLKLNRWPSVNTLNENSIKFAFLTLNYYPRADFQTGNNIRFLVRRLESDWQSSALTWNSQKSITSWPVCYYDIGDRRKVEKQRDVAFVEDWVKRHYKDPSTDYGIRIQPETVTSTINRVCYISSDYAADYYAHPWIEIMYDPDKA